MSLTLPEDVEAVVEVAVRLATAIAGVAAVGLVGSYARGAAGPTSDIDFVVLTDRPQALLESDDWFRLFDPHAELIRSEDFGAIQERRLRLPRGLVVDVGIGRPSWAAVNPVDPGTRRVVSDGLAVLYDPRDLLGGLALAVAN
ncbi:nucleotidyltransferase domain-containing protein [uncultured Jatrophihabitans sp.]|uniref:nucleotidyltransferase domain-containing protein n=1 Tax=uncultured Jatrophihabitans sp. TaxID=1610747 RepID=UPI0035CB491A